MENDLHILVVDLETSDLDAREGSVLDIGAKWLVHPTRAGETFERRCALRPGARWSPEAAEVHGLSYTDCQHPELLSEQAAMAELITWTRATPDRPVILAGLNPSFDRSWIKEAGMRALMDGRYLARCFPHRVIDLHTLAMRDALSQGQRVPVGGLWTDRLYEVLEMQPEPKPHRALQGAEWEWEAFVQLGWGEFQQAEEL